MVKVTNGKQLQIYLINNFRIMKMILTLSFLI